MCTLALLSCAPPAIEGGFHSGNPASKLYAIEQAVRTDDSDALPQIVEQLDSDDPLVRMVAISALERMTGRTYGYRHYDPAPMRAEAVLRWRAALRSGEVSPATDDADGERSDES